MHVSKESAIRHFILSALATSALYAGHTKTLFDPEFDFARVRTFSFIGGAELEKTGILRNPATRDRVKNLIAGILEPRGLREIPRDEKYDLAVRYWVGIKSETRTRMQIDPYWSMWGGYDPFWTSYWYMPYYELTERYNVGTLIIDLLDPKTKQLVWRTFLSERLEETTKTYRNIEKDLGKAFSDLPPSPSKRQTMGKEVAKRRADYRDPVTKP